MKPVVLSQRIKDELDAPLWPPKFGDYAAKDSAFTTLFKNAS